MNSNTSNLILNQAGAVASVASSSSDVTNSSGGSASNNYYHSSKQNYSKWHRNNYNNKKNNSGGGVAGTRAFNNNNNNEDAIDSNQLNENAESNSNEIETNAQVNNNNNKKWSNNKKKQTFQNKPKTPENQKTYKRNQPNYNSQSSNSNDLLKEDLIDSPVYALTNSASSSSRGGSKKTNLNHLLNFNYDTTENYYEYEKYSRQFWSTKFTKSSCFTKEQFLQANCQFVVKNTGDYTVNLCDPDLMVDWDKIEEIHIESHDNISCPICLYPPQIGKIAKCGHIFNWSCILHYLSLSDKPWRKCPICFESIYKKDLKSVRINKFGSEFKVGDEINLNLMFKSKSKNSSLVMPNTLCETFKEDDKKSKISLNRLRSSSYSECNKYMKLHARSAEEIYEQVLQRERDDLLKQLENEKNEPEVCFVNEALELLNERETSLKLEFKRPKTPPQLAKKQDDEIKKVEPAKKPDIVYVDAFEELSLSSPPIETKIEESKPVEEPKLEKTETKELVESKEDTTQQSAVNSNNANNELVYFYQSSDGQRIYINPLNARCLVTQYNSFNLCPNVIKGKIVAYESYFMTEEIRKRFRYLSHLPLHSEFKIVELDIGEPYLSKETLGLFEEEFKERRQSRMRKEQREKRLAARAAAANSDQTPHYYTSSAMKEITVRNNIIDYIQDFPEASSSPPTSSGTSMSGSVNDSSNSEQPSVQPVSFAQMLKYPELNRKNSATNTAWPSLETSSNLTTNQSTQLTSGWLNMAKLQSSQQTSKSKKYQDAPTPWGKSDKLVPDEEVNEPEDAMPAPVYAESFFSAIDESLRIIDSKKASLLDQDTQDGTKQQQQQQKKKKKTKQLLFSTSLNI